MNDERVALRQFIAQHFSLEEVRTLSFDLGLEYDDLPGEGRVAKVRELIRAAERNGRLTNLHTVLEQERPHDYKLEFKEVKDSEKSDPNRRIHKKTSLELIRIPAGPFLFGSSDSDEFKTKWDKPQRRIELPEYWIGRTPVTNAQYKRFLDANPNHEGPYFDAGWATEFNWDRKRRIYPHRKKDHPVVFVSWHDAKAYCAWAGLALPTAEEWEKAARGSDGRIWPWGNNGWFFSAFNYQNKVGTTTVVGTYSPEGDSPYGCVDMAGNVWEWTESAFNDKGDRDWYLLSGGAFDSDLQLTRAAYRSASHASHRSNNAGFRVVGYLSDDDF